MQFQVNAKQVKSLVAVMKEFLDMTIFHFTSGRLILTGVDSEKVSLIQIVLVPLQKVDSSNVMVAVPLLEVYKFLRGAIDIDTVVLTVENIDSGRQILVGRVASTQRNSWYRFPYVNMPMDLITYDPASVDIQSECTLSTKLVLRGLREIVHSHVVVNLKVSQDIVLDTSDANNKGSGGGKVKFIVEDESHVANYQSRFLVRYIQKFVRIIPSADLRIITPQDASKPLQIVGIYYNHSVRLVLSPYVDA